jgi:hypothetical protein
MKNLLFLFLFIPLISCQNDVDEEIINNQSDPFISIKYASFQYSIGGSYGSQVNFTHKNYQNNNFNYCGCMACNTNSYIVEELYYDKSTSTIKYKILGEESYTLAVYGSKWSCKKYE